MNIKTRPLLIAAGIGVMVHIILALLNMLPILLMNTSLFDSGGPESFTAPEAVFGSLAFIGMLSCMGAFVVDVSVGALYAYLHNREELISLQDGLIGGAASGAVARIVSTVFSTILSVIVTPLLLSQMMPPMGADMPPIPPDAPQALLGVTLASGLIGGLFGLCIGLILGTSLGAVGGGVLAAILEKRQD